MAAAAVPYLFPVLLQLCQCVQVVDPLHTCGCCVTGEATNHGPLGAIRHAEGTCHHKQQHAQLHTLCNKIVMGDSDTIQARLLAVPYLIAGGLLRQ
jgi:hypothetical protein